MDSIKELNNKVKELKSKITKLGKAINIIRDIDMVVPDQLYYNLDTFRDELDQIEFDIKVQRSMKYQKDGI